jgi:hypothetical protein
LLNAKYRTADGQRAFYEDGTEVKDPFGITWNDNSPTWEEHQHDSEQALHLQPAWPWKLPETVDPVWILFAAERAIRKGLARQLVQSGKLPKGWSDTADELSGDTASVSRVSSNIAEYAFRSEAIAPQTALKSSPLRGPLFFVGSPYANEVLRMLEREDQRHYPSGAHFDLTSLEKRNELRIVFKKARRAWVHDPMINLEPAIIRRWRTQQGNDALLVAGMTAQGTAGAVDFLLDRKEKYLDALFALLFPSQPNSDDVEYTQFDAVLKIPLKPNPDDASPKPSLIFDLDAEIDIFAAEPRERLG